jgi:hypothetical protein
MYHQQIVGKFVDFLLDTAEDTGRIGTSRLWVSAL